MTLIEVVKQAQSFCLEDAEGPGLCGLQPTWLVSPSSAEASHGELVTWQGAPAISLLLKQREEQEQLLSADLKARPDNSLSVSFLDGLLRSYLEQLCSLNPKSNPNPSRKTKEKRYPNQRDGNVCSDSISSGSFSPGIERVADDSFAKLLKRASPRLGQKLLCLTLRACLISESFDEVESMLDSRAVSGNTYPELIPTLIELHQPALICVWLQTVCDRRFSDLLLIIKYFLSGSLRAGSSLASVRFQWRKLASAATQSLSHLIKAAENNGEPRGIDNGHRHIHKKVQGKNTNLKEELVLRSIALSAAVDHFQPYELCLHSLVSGGHDETVLSSVLSQLENNEALKLLCYLKKWLEQYSSRGSLSGLHREEGLWVPLLGDILQWTSVLLDAHMMPFVLCPDFHPEIQSVQLLIKGLVNDSHKFATLLGTVEHLRTKGGLPMHPSLDGSDEHVIEYLDI